MAIKSVAAETLINDLRSYIGKSIYVWGAQGQVNPDKAWITKRERTTDLARYKQDKNIERIMTLYTLLKNKGIEDIYAFDCSGLLMYHLQQKYGIFSGDASADTLYRRCTAVADIGYDFQPDAGMLVFKLNSSGKATHVGIVSGYKDGVAQVIECYGRDRGVIEQDLDAEGTAYWDRVGILPNIVTASSVDIGQAEPDPDAPNVDPDEPVLPVPVKVKGSVNFRTGPSTAYEKLFVVHDGTYGLAYPEKDGWCHVVMPKGDSFITGYMSAKYLKELV